MTDEPGDELVPENAVDFRRVFDRGGRNCGNEGYALFRCPSCGRIYLLETEAETVYVDPSDLTKRVSALNSVACVECGMVFPDEPWTGQGAPPQFRVTWAQLKASEWAWASRQDDE